MDLRITCPADINQDGFVDFTDLTLVLQHWGAVPARVTFCAADCATDGFVDFDDLMLVMSSWGACEADESPPANGVAE